jgi:hypothetical protein
MNQLEENIVNSFRLCKSDIIKVQNNVTEVAQTQERLMEIVDELRKKVAVLQEKAAKAPAATKIVRVPGKTVIKRLPGKTKIVKQVVVKRVPGKTKVVVKRMPGKTVIKKVVAQRAKTYFVASKTGMKLHDKHCPFAKNIHPKSRIIFHTKDSALNKGFRLCDCLKKR